MVWLVFLGLVSGAVGFSFFLFWLEEKFFDRLPKAVRGLPSVQLFKFLIPAMISTLIIRYTIGFPLIDYNLPAMIIFLFLNMADGATTYYGIKKLGFREINFLLAPSPKTNIWEIMFLKFIFVGVLLLFWGDWSINFRFFLLAMVSWVVFQNLFQIFKKACRN